MISLLGALAAVSAPMAMSAGFIIWGEAWKGSAFSLNMFKCTFASIIFLIVGISIRIPSLKNLDSAMLILSSFLGIVIGDCTWIMALQQIGARRVIIVDATKPFLASALGYFFLGESFYISSIFGISVTIIGVVLASTEKSREPSLDANLLTNITCTKDLIDFDDDVEGSFTDYDDEDDNLRDIDIRWTSEWRRSVSGYSLALLNVVFDCYGFVLTKQYGSSLNTFEINLVRFGSAAFIMLLISFLNIFFTKILDTSQRQSFISEGVQFSVLSTDSDHGDIADQTYAHIRTDDIIDVERIIDDPWFALPINTMTRWGWIQIVAGTIFVTFLCPALSNYAVFELDVGLCLTLTSLGPIFSLPLLYCIKGERVGTMSVIGSMLSIAGVAILIFVHF